MSGRAEYELFSKLLLQQPGAFNKYEMALHLCNLLMENYIPEASNLSSNYYANFRRITAKSEMTPLSAPQASMPLKSTAENENMLFDSNFNDSGEDILLAFASRCDDRVRTITQRPLMLPRECAPISSCATFS